MRGATHAASRTANFLPKIFHHEVTKERRISLDVPCGRVDPLEVRIPEPFVSSFLRGESLSSAGAAAEDLEVAAGDARGGGGSADVASMAGEDA